MCVLISSTTFVWNISHSKKNWARYDKKCVSVFMWSTRYSCQSFIKPELSRQIFSRNTQISNFMKIRPVRAELFHTDGQTWRIVAFRNFSKASKHWLTISCLAWNRTRYYSITASLICSVILLNILKDLESILCPVTWSWKQNHLPKSFSKIMWWWTMSKYQPRKITTKTPYLSLII
jgi:hypothetical protein